MFIIPSILTNNPEEALDLIKQCEGVVERVSIDIIDGKFADNKTVDPLLFEEIDTPLKLDFQLMVDEPIHWVERCVRAGADRIIGHIERMKNQTEFVKKVSEAGIGVGLALDLDTDVSSLDTTIINDLDVVLLMSVKAGFGGQKFSDKVFEKIKILGEMRSKDKTPFSIQIDGGVNEENIGKLIELGVDEVSIGRRLFEGGVRKNINNLITK